MTTRRKYPVLVASAIVGSATK